MSIVGRTHEGRPIFVTDDDRLFFVDRLRSVFRPGAVDLLAWGLLVNHFHLVIRVLGVPPGELFLRLMSPVARRERRRRGDYGTVWGDRYWSGRCRDDGGLFALLLYVLGNPVHHGVVPNAEALETYPWTGYPEILGLCAPRLVEPAKTLAHIHPDLEVARGILREGMSGRAARWQAERNGVDLCEEPGCRGADDLCGGVHRHRVRRRAAPSARAGSDALATVAREHDERVARAAALQARGWRPADLVVPVCARFGADPQALLGGGRKAPESAARALIACVACDAAGVPMRVLADVLGVSGAAVSLARERGAALLAARGWTAEDVLAWCGPDVADVPRVTALAN